LFEENPELREALDSLSAWCQDHPQVGAIDPRRVVHEKHTPPEQLVRALTLLVHQGMLKLAYQYETPDGYLISQDFQSYSDVPDELSGRFDETFRREDGLIIPVYRIIEESKNSV
jgi:hypothetical protein